MLELLTLRKGTPVTKETFLNNLYSGMDDRKSRSSYRSSRRTLPFVKTTPCKVTLSKATLFRYNSCRVRPRLGSRSCAPQWRPPSNWVRGVWFRLPRSMLDPFAKLPSGASLCHYCVTSWRYGSEKQGGFTMTTIASARRWSYGMRCAHCNNALIAPEWTEERNDRQIHVWRCWRCDFYFETIHTQR